MPAALFLPIDMKRYDGTLSSQSQSRIWITARLATQRHTITNERRKKSALVVHFPAIATAWCMFAPGSLRWTMIHWGEQACRNLDWGYADVLPYFKV